MAARSGHVKHCAIIAVVIVAGCSRRPPEPPSASQPEIPADASIRLITDPLPATPPRETRDTGPALLPIGVNAPSGDPMLRLVPIPPDASAAPFVPR